MDKREEILIEALQKNNEESQRWQLYLKENETAIENMTTFGKRLTVDVMVPVGKKAFMTGHLYHTNEVLVGHYQGYFSECTSFKAKDICELRIKMAKEHLKKLETEADLWINKLDKPHAEGVIPTGEVQEIIEEYNEEEEKLFKEKHRIRVRQAKHKGREKRERLQKQNPNCQGSNQDIFQMLEEAELKEELEKELDSLPIDEVNDETIRMLMSGELKLPQEKHRFAYNKNTEEEKTSEETLLSKNIEKKTFTKNYSRIRSNNNVQTNPEISNLLNMQDQEEELEEEKLPKEVALIKDQAKYLNAEEQIGFYDYQIQIIKQKLRNLSLNTTEELDEKIRLLNILECFEELLEEVEEIAGEAELAEEKENSEKEENFPNEFFEQKRHDFDTNSKCKQKAHISFDSEDKILEFRKHEAVTQMLPSKRENPQSDIIKLEDTMEHLQRDIIKLENTEEQRDDNQKQKGASLFNKMDLIQVKVEKNLLFVSENQSKQHFDLVEQILQSSKGDINTLQIKFKHSQQEEYKNKENCTIPGNPADFFKLYIKQQKSLENGNESSTIFINGYEGEEQVKVPVMKEADRHVAFADPKSEFSNPIQAKSILKNKSAVHKEWQSILKKEEECLRAYNKVMDDVVEKPLLEPEPLPDVKFIDAKTPKKRISRFKQMRKGNGTV